MTRPSRNVLPFQRTIPKDNKVVRILEVKLPASDAPSVVEIELLVPADAAEHVQIRAFRVTE